jgi:hypothetical protein
MESISTPQRIADKKLNNEAEKQEQEEISDETEEKHNDDEIEDFYEDEATPKHPGGLGEELKDTDNHSENIDLDYSQTHLEDFLKS